MKTFQTPPEELARLRGLAERLDCIIEEDFHLLAEITPGTAYAWRQRKRGPAYVLLGNRVLYPCQAVATHLETLRRDMPAATGKKLL